MCRTHSRTLYWMSKCILWDCKWTYGPLCSLNLSSWDRTMRVGINGLVGVGKNTLAKAVYNKINGGFDACCFVFNIGASIDKNSRLVDLQRMILRRLVNCHIEISSVDEGKCVMRDRLRGVCALVILDGVNGDWFGHGSRIIITCREEHVLKITKVDSVELFTTRVGCSNTKVSTCLVGMLSQSHSLKPLAKRFLQELPKLVVGILFLYKPFDHICLTRRSPTKFNVGKKLSLILEKVPKCLDSLESVIMGLMTLKGNISGCSLQLCGRKEKTRCYFLGSVIPKQSSNNYP